MSQIIMAEGAAPNTPAIGKAVIFVNASGRLCFMNDNGDLICIDHPVGTVVLTVPATGVAALLGVDQTFTETNTFAPAGTGATDRAILIQMPNGSTAQPLRVEYNGVNAFAIVADADESRISVASRDLGNNISGPSILLGRNANAGAEGPAAGVANMFAAGGTGYHLWVDAAGNFRIHTAAPTGSSGSPTVADTAGTVVGTQTSMREAKLISDDLSVLSDVMARIREGAEAVRRFRYRSGSYNDQVFEGVVTDYAEDYGMDRDAEHPQGKSLNTIQIIGDLLRTVDWLVQRVSQLEAR